MTSSLIPGWPVYAAAAVLVLIGCGGVANGNDLRHERIDLSVVDLFFVRFHFGVGLTAVGFWRPFQFNPEVPQVVGLDGGNQPLNQAVGFLF